MDLQVIVQASKRGLEWWLITKGSASYDAIFVTYDRKHLMCVPGHTLDVQEIGSYTMVDY